MRVCSPPGFYTRVVLTHEDRDLFRRADAGETLTTRDLTRLTKCARQYGRMAMFSAQTAIARGPQHQWAATAARFTEDAYEFARVAFHAARLRLDARHPVKPWLANHEEGQ